MLLSFMRRLQQVSLVALFSVPAFANDVTPIDLPRQEQAIVMDGKLDEPEWQTAKQVELNYVVRPFENTTPPVKTTVFIFEDGETLFIGFKADDHDPEKISAFYRDRDKAWDHDLVGIKLDPFNDGRLAYEFFVNPYGVQLDAIENEMTGSESDSWDTIWETAGAINEDGYIVEIAIPLRVLNFNESADPLTWGMELVRFYPREERYRISNMPIDRNNSCNLCQMGKVKGFAGAKQGGNLAVIPAVVAGRGETRDLTDDDSEWEHNNDVEVSLDVKWSITPDTSLVATVNPDFSQVEADVAQLSINNTFSLFFPEKRAFFLENQDYFSTENNLVYTRNISSPDYGGKLTGRLGNQTFGLFAANDTSTTMIIPGNRGSSLAEINDKSTNATARYRYDFSDDFSLGWISTVREADDYHNYVNAMDAKWRPTENDTIIAQFMATDTEYPLDLYEQFCDEYTDEETGEEVNCDAPAEEVDCEFGDCHFNESVLRTKHDDNITDIGYSLEYNHRERDWFTKVRHNARGRDFRADLGFIPTADQERTGIEGGYIWYNESSWWNRVQVDSEWDITHNENGELIEKELEGHIRINAIQQSFFRIGVVKRDLVGPRIDASSLDIDGNTTLFSQDNITSYFEMRPSANFFWAVSANIGDEIDYANNRLGDVIRISPQIDWNMNDHIQFRLRHTYRELEVEDKLLFRANLTDARFTYQFDVKSFIRLSMIYSHIDRNQSNYLYDTVDSHSADLSTQLLYAYKVNPYTLFFLGYSDSHVEDDEIDSLKQGERSVFMKLSYAWLQ